MTYCYVYNSNNMHGIKEDKKRAFFKKILLFHFCFIFFLGTYCFILFSSAKDVLIFVQFHAVAKKV